LESEVSPESVLVSVVVSGRKSMFGSRVSLGGNGNDGVKVEASSVDGVVQFCGCAGIVHAVSGELVLGVVLLDGAATARGLVVLVLMFTAGLSCICHQ